MQKEISKKIISKIKKERITPDSRWKINWKNYAFWIILCGMIFLGALFFSLIIFNITDIDRDLYFHFRFKNFIWLILKTAPFLWIILSVLALTFGLLAFQKTKHGYRYQALFVTSIIVLAISILGILTHSLKINDRANDKFSKNIPHYRQLASPKELRWLRPEEGLLAGEIIEVMPDEAIIVDFKNELWTVDYSEETFISPKVKMEKEEKIRMIGEKTGNFYFKARMIKKMNGPGMPPPRNFGKGNF